MNQLRNRVVIAGTHSGVGKTTVATGLMAAIRAKGFTVAPAKVGPDYIDPGYHQLACRRPGRNLDPWISGVASVGPLAARAAEKAQLFVIEGVMGLFDGAVDGSPSSTADVAESLECPVLLVVDGSAMSGSVAALVRGFRDHRSSVNIAGVILNRIASDRHRILLTEALAAIDIKTLGCLPRDDSFKWRDRHLGLVPVAEDAAAVTASIDILAAAVARHCDLAAIAEIAKSAPQQTHRPVRMVAPGDSDRAVRIAVAGGAAFTFSYLDNLEALEAAGAELVLFDPLVEEQLPSGVDGLVVGGGFPEVFASVLASNSRLLADVSKRVSAGLVTWVECGGLLWLCSFVDGQPMVGSIAARAKLGERLTLGYRNALVSESNPLAAAGTRLRGHEFHYSEVDPPGQAMTLSSRFSEHEEGFASATLLATFFHQHLGDHPEPAARFVETCRNGWLGKEAAR